MHQFLKFIFGIKLYMFRTVPLSIIRSFSLYTQQWYTGLLTACEQDQDDGQRNRPKHVEFYSKNKFEKLVHPVGFIIRIYHDARSPERQRVRNCPRTDAVVVVRVRVTVLWNWGTEYKVMSSGRNIPTFRHGTIPEDGNILYIIITFVCVDVKLRV